MISGSSETLADPLQGPVLVKATLVSSLILSAQKQAEQREPQTVTDSFMQVTQGQIQAGFDIGQHRIFAQLPNI